MSCRILRPSILFLFLYFMFFFVRLKYTITLRTISGSVKKMNLIDCKSKLRLIQLLLLVSKFAVLQVVMDRCLRICYIVYYISDSVFVRRTLQPVVFTYFARLSTVACVSKSIVQCMVQIW